jgi:hypothetical protein
LKDRRIRRGIVGVLGVRVDPGAGAGGGGDDVQAPLLAGGGDEGVFDGLADFVALLHETGLVEDHGDARLVAVEAGVIAADGVGIGGQKIDGRAVVEDHPLAGEGFDPAAQGGFADEVEDAVAETGAHALPGGDYQHDVAGSGKGAVQGDDTGGLGFARAASGDEKIDAALGEGELFLVFVEFEMERLAGESHRIGQPGIGDGDFGQRRKRGGGFFEIAVHREIGAELGVIDAVKLHDLGIEKIGFGVQALGDAGELGFEALEALLKERFVHGVSPGGK